MAGVGTTWKTSGTPGGQRPSKQLGKSGPSSSRRRGPKVWEQPLRAAPRKALERALQRGQSKKLETQLPEAGGQAKGQGGGSAQARRATDRVGPAEGSRKTSWGRGDARPLM